MTYGVANIWRFLHAVSVLNFPQWGKLTGVTIGGLAALFGADIDPGYASLIERVFYTVKQVLLRFAD
ncbi:hypothetical protein EWJ01_19530 [Salmonella enterica subsp. enterica serovar Mikawasima]|nr:hypothetical protein [Salmonella enterica subsp. enterica serovar Mikawasima]